LTQSHFTLRTHEFKCNILRIGHRLSLQAIAMIRTFGGFGGFIPD